MCDRCPRKFVPGLIFVVNIKFPRASYHTIVPSTEDLYCLNRAISLESKILCDFLVTVTELFVHFVLVETV